MPEWLAIVLVLALVGLVVRREWRREVMPYSAPAGQHKNPGPVTEYPLYRAEEFHTDDEDWADQLHAINQLGKFGDLTRPVAHLTHYEVEALIQDLGVAEWVPERLRAAA